MRAGLAAGLHKIDGEIDLIEYSFTLLKIGSAYYMPFGIGPAFYNR